MKQFHYVYILKSKSYPDRYYVGYTTDLERRLKEHNSKKLPNTARYVPWVVQSAHAFCSKATALAFEKYLKSPSGRAFTKKRLSPQG